MRLTATFTVAVGLLALVGPRPVESQEPLGVPAQGDTGVPTACGAARLADPSLEWSAEVPLAADFTLDGMVDAAVWGGSGDDLVVLVGRCVGGAVAEQWRFPLTLPAGCDARAARVEAGSLRMDEALVERACAAGQRRPECIQLREENARRQALTDAGGREIRIEVPGCHSARLRWDPDRGGFMMLRP